MERLLKWRSFFRNVPKLEHYILAKTTVSVVSTHEIFSVLGTALNGIEDHQQTSNFMSFSLKNRKLLRFLTFLIFKPV